MSRAARQQPLFDDARALHEVGPVLGERHGSSVDLSPAHGARRYLFCHLTAASTDRAQSNEVLAGEHRSVVPREVNPFSGRFSDQLCARQRSVAPPRQVARQLWSGQDTGASVDEDLEAGLRKVAGTQKEIQRPKPSLGVGGWIIQQLPRYASLRTCLDPCPPGRVTETPLDLRNDHMEENGGVCSA